MTILKGILFYLSLTIIMLFLCGGFMSIIWWPLTIISGATVFFLFKHSTESDYNKFTGITWFKNKTGIDLSEE